MKIILQESPDHHSYAYSDLEESIEAKRQLVSTIVIEESSSESEDTINEPDIFEDLLNMPIMYGGKLNSDAIDMEADGYIRVATGMSEGRKKPMKWISSLSMCLAIRKLRAGLLKSEEEFLIQCSMLTRKEAMWIRTQRGMNVYDFLKDKYDTIFFSVFGVEHWSLLVWYIGSEKGFWHYDSLKNVFTGEDINMQPATEIVAHLGWANVLPVVRCDIHMPKWMPSQPGGWECGHYVLMTVIFICTEYLKTSSMPTETLTKEYTTSYTPDNIKSLWKQYAVLVQASVRG